MQGLLELPDHPVGEGLTGIAGQPASPAGELGDQALTLLGLTAQLGDIEVGLGSAQGRAGVQQLRHLVATLAHQLVGEPGRGRGSAQLFDGGGQLAVTTLSGARRPNDHGRP